MVNEAGMNQEEEQSQDQPVAEGVNEISQATPEELSSDKFGEVFAELQQHYNNVACNLRDMDIDQKWSLYLQAGRERDGRMHKHFPVAVGDAFLCGMGVELSPDSMRAYFEAMTSGLPEESDEEVLRTVPGQLTLAQEVQLNMLDTQMGKDTFVWCFQREHAGGAMFGRCHCTVKGNPKNPNIRHFEECWAEFFDESLSTQSFRDVDVNASTESDLWLDGFGEVPELAPFQYQSKHVQATA